jgi:RNA polymerase sigma-70 factor (ECF subfamily)
VDYDDRLLTAGAGGDREAFAAFYRRWLPAIASYHLRRTHSRELAFDLTAETFAAVVAGCGRFDPVRASACLEELPAHLPAEQRQAVRARVLEERPFADIASELECSQAVIRQRVHRGLSRMREGLEELS